MPEKIIYKTKATAKGGREGHVSSEDGTIDLTLVKPKEMGGDGTPGANPETLFACGYAACFESAARFAASKAGFTVGPQSYVTAEVGIGPRPGSGFQLDVTLYAHLDGLDKQDAEMVVQTAHNELCPYSHATRGNVNVKLQVV